LLHFFVSRQKSGKEKPAEEPPKEENLKSGKEPPRRLREKRLLAEK
jgi:hypothetical protein